MDTEQHCALNLSDLPGLEENAATSIRVRDMIEQEVFVIMVKLFLQTNPHTHALSHPSNLGSESIVLTHWCCGPTDVQFCANATRAPVSRSP